MKDLSLTKKYFLVKQKILDLYKRLFERPVRLRVVFKVYEEPVIKNTDTCPGHRDYFKKKGFDNPKILFKLGVTWLNEHSRKNMEKAVGIYEIKEKNDLTVLEHVDELAEITLPTGYVDFYLEQTSRGNVAIGLTRGWGLNSISCMMINLKYSKW